MASTVKKLFGICLLAATVDIVLGGRDKQCKKLKTALACGYEADCTWFEEDSVCLSTFSVTKKSCKIYDDEDSCLAADADCAWYPYEHKCQAHKAGRSAGYKCQYFSDETSCALSGPACQWYTGGNMCYPSDIYDRKVCMGYANETTCAASSDGCSWNAIREICLDVESIGCRAYGNQDSCLASPRDCAWTVFASEENGGICHQSEEASKWICWSQTNETSCLTAEPNCIWNAYESSCNLYLPEHNGNCKNLGEDTCSLTDMDCTWYSPKQLCLKMYKFSKKTCNEYKDASACLAATDANCEWNGKKCKRVPKADKNKNKKKNDDDDDDDDDGDKKGKKDNGDKKGKKDNGDKKGKKDDDDDGPLPWKVL